MFKFFQFFVVALFVLQSAGADSSMEIYLDRYSQGDLPAVDRAFVHRDVTRFLRHLNEGGSRWVHGRHTSAQPRAALTVASFALEAASLLESRRAQERLIEWGCGWLKQFRVETNGERQWHRAAVALLQRHPTEMTNIERDWRGHWSITAKGHLAHALKRFPTDRRLHMAVAIGVEALTWEQGNYVNELIQLLTPLAEDPEVGAEGMVRLGNSLIRIGQWSKAKDLLRAVESRTSDPDLRYLARLLIARELDRRNDPGTVEAYQGCVAILPGAQSCSLPLAALMFLAGQREASSHIIDLALKNKGVDPWSVYPHGDYSRFSARIRCLRQEAVR